MWIRIDDNKIINLSDNASMVYVEELTNDSYGITANYVNDVAVTLAVYSSYKTAEEAFKYIISHIGIAYYIELPEDGRLSMPDDTAVSRKLCFNCNHS